MPCSMLFSKLMDDYYNIFILVLMNNFLAKILNVAMHGIKLWKGAYFVEAIKLWFVVANGR